MYFKRIEIHGFKSFAEPVTIEFDRGITCVVGPNGSGKSNICDAIRWVLGAQSAKALRGDKMEDVIFSGTANRKSRGMAEVTLVIDNENGELPIDYKEVAIARRMYRSGESEYLINGARCRMKDIRELIMDTGIGVEGYSIIGQGKISDIISNNTESIREILEETAGIVMYRSRKAEAERKLGSATDNMDRVNDIIGEIEGRIDRLKEQSEKATEYLQLRDRHKELEINITLKNIENIQLKNAEIKDDLTNLEKQIGEAEIKQAALATKMQDGNRRRDQIDAGLEEKRAEERRLSEELSTLRGKLQLDSQRIKTIEENKSRLMEEIADFSAKIDRERENAQGLEEEKEKIIAKLQELSDALQAAISVNADKTEKAGEMGNAIDEKRNRIFTLTNEIGSKQAERSSIESLKETLAGNKERLLAAEKESGAGRQTSEGSLETAQKEKEDIAAKEAGVKARLDKAKEDRLAATSKERELSAALETLRVEVGRLTARKKTLEEMETNYEGYSGAVKFIMRDKPAGVEGVVADLIDVPHGYETAIETALGNTMQNVVCEDDATAKECIRLLKHGNAGRLTFLPLTSIKPKTKEKPAEAEKAPGFKGYATDMIRFDGRYQLIMEYLLGGVIIVDNMDNAVSLSKRLAKRGRIVTLDGEVINPAGAITGGRFKHKTANILERKVEIGDLEKAVREKTQTIAENQQAQGKAARQAEDLVKIIEEQDQALQQVRREGFAKENEITVLRTSLSDMESASERRQDELNNIAAQLEKSDNTIADCSAAIEAKTKEKAELEKLVEAAMAEYEAQREMVREGSEAITKARIDVTAQESEKGKIDAIARRIEETIAEYDGEKQARENTLAEQEEELKALMTSAVPDEGPLQEKENLLETVLAALTKLTEEKESLRVAMADDIGAQEQVDAEHRSLQNQKYELDIRQARQDAQLENAKEKLWEEFEVSYVQAMDFKAEDFVLSAAVKENREIKSRLKELGEVNVGAIKEYAEVKERYDFLSTQRADIEQSMNELNGIIRDMDKIIRTRFKDSFDRVVVNFEAVFRDLYGGGHASISLANEDDPFNSEIEIQAQPPGKQLKHINLLSGGEKTMTAIALMFAVLKTKPTPCCILDEIEAALDDRNLEIFGEYVKAFPGVQFTLITHQKATMEHADVMYGITMPESGISKVYSLKMEDAGNLEVG